MVLQPPGVVIFVNNDLTDNVKNFLSKQLFITEVLDGYIFDDRVAADADYLNKLCQLNQRIMVVRSFVDDTNRNLAHIVIFVSHGLAAVLENKFGPPGITFPVVDLTWGKLGIYE